MEISKGRRRDRISLNQIVHLSFWDETTADAKALFEFSFNFIITFTLV